MKNTYETMTRAQLAAAYVDKVGYDPFQDDPQTTEAEIAQTLAEWDAECAARTVRIFADVGGFYYSSGSLDARGRAFPTIAACVRYLRDSNALRDVPFTHYVRGERVRSLWGEAVK